MKQIEFRKGDIWLDSRNNELEILDVKVKQKYIRYRNFSERGYYSQYWIPAAEFNDKVLFKVGTVKEHKSFFGKTTYSIDYI